MPLAPWCTRHASFFAVAARETQAAVEAVRSDYGVQAHFGKRWFSNMLRNMEAAEKQGREVPRRSRACVTAAGPSLEAQLGQLAAARDGGILLASDTSLPALLQAGIAPDAVLSIDCQNHGYHHFLKGLPETTTLFLDLASPPFLARLTRRTFFVASGHPFAAYLGARWMELPGIDMSGGNVTHAAMSLARGLGAREITLFGADFSYPGGRSYCRGTYLHDLFHSRQGRLSPTESSFFSFIFRDPMTTRERLPEGTRYTTPVLRGYRDRLLELMGSLDADCTAAPGEGLPLDHERPASRKAAVPLHWFPPRCGWREFLRGFADELRSLPPLEATRWAAMSSLRPEQRELWNVLLPVAARVEMECANRQKTVPALEEAREWASAASKGSLLRGSLVEDPRVPHERLCRPHIQAGHVANELSAAHPFFTGKTERRQGAAGGAGRPLAEGALKGRVEIQGEQAIDKPTVVHLPHPLLGRLSATRPGRTRSWSRSG